MKKEYVILVDETNTPIGKEEKIRAHELGLLHKAFSVFLFRKKDNKTQLLLQQRAKHKYHCGGLWTNTCCSHPHEGEDIIYAGKRRLQEEMGINIDTLKQIGTFTYKAAFANGLTEHEIDTVLIDTYIADNINFNKDEVEAIRWISLHDLEKELEENPETFTPWFPLALSMISEDIIAHLFTGTS